MWLTVLLMAVVAGADPVRVGAVAFMLTRQKPLRLLLGYWIGGFGLSLVIGLVVVFVLKDLKVGAGSSIPPEIEIAVGALAILVAILVGTKISAKGRDAIQARKPDVTLPNFDVAAHPEGPPGIESMPGFAKLPERVKKALAAESPRVAWIAGLAVGMPTAYYIAAIAAVLKSGSSAGVQVAALVVFNVIAFLQAEVPIVSYLVAPEGTRDFVRTHLRLGRQPPTGGRHGAGRRRRRVPAHRGDLQALTGLASSNARQRRALLVVPLWMAG